MQEARQVQQWLTRADLLNIEVHIFRDFGCGRQLRILCQGAASPARQRPFDGELHERWSASVSIDQ